MSQFQSYQIKLLYCLPNVEISFPGMSRDERFVRDWSILTVESLTFEPVKSSDFKSTWIKDLRTGPVSRPRLPSSVTSTFFTFPGKDWATTKCETILSATTLVHLVVHQQSIRKSSSFGELVREKQNFHHFKNTESSTVWFWWLATLNYITWSVCHGLLTGWTGILHFVHDIYKEYHNCILKPPSCFNRNFIFFLL